MKRSSFALMVFMGTFLLISPGHAQPAGSGYHIIDSLRLGGEGGWDYLSVDTAAQRLYVSRGTRVQVVDLSKHSIAGEIPNTPGVHGIALVSAVGRGYTSNGRDSSVTVFDLKSLNVIATLKINARNPDAILYDPFSRRVFTLNGGSANATAIDVESNTVVGSIPLGGKPEFGVSDARGRIYVNIEDKSEVVMIDPMNLTVLKRWPLSPGEEPTGLALDREHRRLFAVCGNRLMAILDADSGNVVATPAIGDGVDGVMYDRATRLAFSANGEGTMTVVREETPAKYSLVENVPTRRSARTLVLDEKSHRIYTVAARFGPPPPPTADRPHPRPTIVPESVTLYVIGR